MPQDSRNCRSITGLDQYRIRNKKATIPQDAVADGQFTSSCGEGREDPDRSAKMAPQGHLVCRISLRVEPAEWYRLRQAAAKNRRSRRQARKILAEQALVSQGGQRPSWTKNFVLR